MIEKLRKIRVKIRGYTEAGCIDELAYFDVLDTPDDKTLGASINKAIHDKKADYFKIQVVPKEG